MDGNSDAKSRPPGQGMESCVFCRRFDSWDAGDTQDPHDQDDVCIVFSRRGIFFEIGRSLNVLSAQGGDYSATGGAVEVKLQPPSTERRYFQASVFGCAMVSSLSRTSGLRPGETSDV
jgi:hypothetical protein